MFVDEGVYQVYNRVARGERVFDDEVEGDHLGSTGNTDLQIGMQRFPSCPTSFPPPNEQTAEPPTQ